MKKCSKIRNLFGSYLCDGVTPDERAAVEGHIGTCEKCSSELQNLRKLLEKVRPDSESPDFNTPSANQNPAYAGTDSPQDAGWKPALPGESFASSVYRRIASDALRRRSRQVFLRRFVLQPSLAAVTVAGLIAIGFFRFYPGTITVDKTPPGAMLADEISTKKRRASLYVKEFFRSQGAPYEGKEHYAAVGRASATERPSSDVALYFSNPDSPTQKTDIDRLMQDRLLPESQRLLEEADFINYSLGDRRRALAIYQWVVDYYPDTDAAMRARVRIGSISSTDYNIRFEEVDPRVRGDRIVDTGI